MPPASTTPTKRVRAEHGAIVLLIAGLAGGGFKGITSVQDLSSRIDKHEARIDKREELQVAREGKTETALSAIQLTLAEIRAQGVARDAAFDRLDRAQVDNLKAIRELEEARATCRERLTEHDRRLAAVEGRK